MAAPGGKFFIQDKLQTAAPHHTSYQQLWETKWKKPVSFGWIEQLLDGWLIFQVVPNGCVSFHVWIISGF